jgi:hypothetical protein
MDTEQTNRVTMFKTVSSYLDANSSVWSGMVPLQTAVTQFKSKITAIDATVQKQETPSGAAIDKSAARDALEDVLFLTCEALGVLGHTGNDHDLSALTTVTPSSLEKLDEEELSNRAANVLVEANSRKTPLATLRVTQANLDELEQKLEDFNASKANPRAATVARKAQTASLPGLIREASGILRNEIDRLVNLFRRTNADFVAGYRGARVIVDRRVRHTTTQPAESSPQATPPVA